MAAVKQRVSGRTPEQQAARDARKLTKQQKKAKEDASTAMNGETEAESSSMAVARETSPTSGSKRPRPAQDIPEDELLDIDVDAPAPFSKAELRANRKRVKKGLPELPAKVTEDEKPAKKQRKQLDGQGDALDDDELGNDDNVSQRERAKPQISIWIGNLSFRTTEETLQSFIEKGLSGLGGGGQGEEAVTRVKLPKKPGKGQFAENKGFAYVDLATPELQALAVGLSESFFEGRKLLIKLGDDHKADPNARTPKPLKIQGIPASLASKQHHAESATLFVGNLPFDATEAGLRDLIEGNAAPQAISAESVQIFPPEKAEEDAEFDEEEKTEKPKDLDADRGGLNSGLRKARVAAFEDTGKCKGFAFLDFRTPQQATAALQNGKNYFLNGRKLLLQYASAEATKRSGSGPKKHVRPERRERHDPSDRPLRPPKEGKHLVEDGGAAAIAASIIGNPILSDDKSSEPRTTKARVVGDKRGKKWEAAGRPRPGAALALAKREKVGIVAGQGEKITFD